MPELSKDDMEQIVVGLYEVWLRWETTRKEAVTRGNLPAQAVTALTNRTNVAWDAYVDGLTQWRQAT
jgi:hypothetical protein